MQCTENSQFCVAEIISPRSSSATFFFKQTLHPTPYINLECYLKTVCMEQNFWLSALLTYWSPKPDRSPETGSETWNTCTFYLSCKLVCHYEHDECMIFRRIKRIWYMPIAMSSFSIEGRLQIVFVCILNLI